MTAPHATYGHEMAELLNREHLSIPPTMWGYFVPVTVACWRFLNRHVANVPAVHLQKWDLIGVIPSRITIEGEHYFIERFPAGTPSLPEDPAAPVFIGDGLDTFLDLISRDGPLLDAIEAISWLFAKSLTPERVRSGIVRPEDLPQLQHEQCGSLAALLLEGIAQPPSGAAV
jgi:hypothetical protein